MEIPAKYNPAETEDKWYRYWMEKGFFHSEPDEREPYTIVIPPPNVTGVLHMGHMLNNTIQDILTRRARMLGKNACWVPGTDHASIATEAKVVGKLKDQGISKFDLSRDEFLEHAWEWTHKHGGIILEQLKKLGASCDWDRTAFTMDEPRSESVINVFVDLYNKGLIYRGVRMVNWDPAAKTALSDEEVIYKEVQSKLYYLKYKIEEAPSNSLQGGEKMPEGSNSFPLGEGREGASFVTIATTRPETILGDTAVCVNPNDPRFTHLKGKRVLVPLINRSIPIIEDEYVDMEFGTGCLKITPAHDVNDYEIGLRFNLPSIDIFNDDGTMSEKAELFIGEDRMVVREKIMVDLEKAGNVAKVEDYTNKVGFSERTHVPIEPKLSAQWFLKMEELVKPALANVMDDTIMFYPPKFKNTYRHWMENIKDWCISRQLWWGHRIPVWYIKTSAPLNPPEGGTWGFVVAESEEKARELVLVKHPSLGGDGGGSFSLSQDEDVLDTWFSSWLWPISVFDGIRDPENKEIQYYYPTNDLVTAPDIIFFWVARMIITGYEYRQKYPFKNVYFTGMVRDKLRRKMSKSLGNSPDPLDLIATYGADGVRVGMLLCSPAGGDLLFDESLPQQGAGFVTKIWNSFRLVNGWEVDHKIPQPEHSKLAINWFHEKFSQIVEQTDDHFDKFRISDALMSVYTTVRDEFSGWLLEMVKPAYQQPIDGKTYQELIDIFDEVLRFLHPFMPFVSEEIWQLLKERKDGESIMISAWPKSTGYDETMIARFEDVKEAIAGLRTIRTKNNIPNKDQLELSIIQGDKGFAPEFNSVLVKMGNLSALNMVNEEVKGAASFLVKSTTFFVPLGEKVDIEEELKKLQSELDYAKGFLSSVLKKLSNERFVSSAPANVVATERAKQADAEAKIKVLEEQITNLK
ncbi:MAG: valine--tRNA ligase [Bacteroidetes bacterium GWF2_42_66]|nr:MAG: valine--tRNA ligase [Bacteroidetes bacterium GWA2_42_15]OFY01975.1 MAG: valine--tRNA ligase [Bacteroidetes bacterium GWE2_42_39]OFY44916.1 MAG: valine--tRNA ligase [Bacteroidetes bacterium GWF2_42_66]HBL76046.1 valine--tRNA ligase [Prolixibacteraceae bacterium]HCU62162.1 valine--tRNA ligase [Prolixibacteraceae bacterium]